MRSYERGAVSEGIRTMKSVLRISVLSCLLGLTAPLASCGGGGGSGGSGDSQPPASITFSATSISFSAAKPYSATPADQTISGTVIGSVSGTLYIKIIENNHDIATASDFTVSGNSGQATIIPANPANLLAGTHQGSFTVHACLNDSTCATGELAGSPQTISVMYDVGSSVDADTVMPRVVAPNTGGALILRGHGFTGASAVSFGATAAASFSVVSDSEIHASYPPLAPGSYAISIDSGDVAYSATLDVINPPAFTATFLPYSAGTPGAGAVSSVTYDPERSAVLVVVGANGSPRTLVRYAFDGTSWGAPTQITLSGLQQVSVSPDGTKLFALLATPSPQSLTMAELDPVTLAQTNSTTVTQQFIAPFTGNVDGGFAYSNDGNAIVWSDAMNLEYAFGTSSRTWAALHNTLAQGVLPGPTFGSADGSEVLAAPWQEYVASQGAVREIPTVSNTDDSLAAVNPTGTQFAFRSAVIVDQNGDLLGRVAGADGMVFNPAGTRLYEVEPLDSQPKLHTFDVTATPSNGNYPELGAPITLAGDTSTLVVEQLLAITPDGGTVFVAGSDGIAVQPVPP